MFHLIKRSCARIIFVAMGITLINFFLLHLAPGDAAQALAGQSGAATPEYMEALRRQLGLDQPLYTQFFLYAKNLLTLDLGFSFHHGLPVSTLIWQQLPATLLLMVSAISFALITGCLLGFVAALHTGKFADPLISVLSLLLYATPAFWVGMMLILVFSVQLDLLPIGGMITVEEGAVGLAYIKDVSRHMILPAITLGLYYLAVYTRLMRAEMLAVSGQDFVRTARAKGVRPWRIAWRHTFRNALLPVVTTLGVQLGSILGGAVLVETVFSWPGLGRLALTSLFQRDINLLLGILFCSSIVVVLTNIIIDFVYMRLDPRIRPE
ncbi:MAG: ABC transporter permease [Deltaproteobacteria bacterium]|jgi:peptide/nickel transport system permease protein|nr:ABC transporter permease [Deltaproteobacteria bacterium]